MRRNGIEYGIGAIPLGGYVKIPGMHRPAPSEVDAHFGRAVQEAPQLIGPAERLKRLLAEGDFDGAGGALKALERAAADADLSPSAIKAVERGVTEIADELGLDAYWRQRTWKKIAVIGAGPGTNLVFAMVMFALLLMLGPGRATTTVGEIEREIKPGQPTPAAQIGLRPGDQIVAVNGTRVDASKMFELILESKGDPVRITVERQGREIVLGPVRPFEDTDGAYRIGFRPRFDDLPVGTAAVESVRLTWAITKEIGGVLGRLVQGSGREEISSPIGIVRGSSDALDRGWETYLWVLGLISLSLALLNLLPLLPLDGGHIASRSSRGFAPSRRPEVYERVSVVGSLSSCCCSSSASPTTSGADGG